MINEVLFLLGLALGESTIEWIHRVHPSCCDHRDCFLVQAWRSTGGQWTVLWHGVERPYLNDVRPSPDETIACGTEEVIRCLFIKGGTT